MLLTYRRGGVWRVTALSDRAGMDALEWVVARGSAGAGEALRELARGEGHPGWLVVLEALRGAVRAEHEAWLEGAIVACGGARSAGRLYSRRPDTWPRAPVGAPRPTREALP